MMVSAAVALFWVIMAIGTSDRQYLLGAVILICAEMAWHASCYIALVRRAISKTGRKVK